MKSPLCDFVGAWFDAYNDQPGVLEGPPGFLLVLCRQRRLNRRLEVFRSNAALEAGDHGAVLAHQELLEVPLHITGGIHLVERCLRLGGAPLGMHLLEQLEVSAVGG